ncbi:MAG: imidazole glycerol phosphate synthase subunit HisH [Micrococcales bacterium]
MTAKVAVLDYGSGNVHSVVKAIQAAGAEVILTRDRTEIENADGLVVPGVGAFDAVMQQLNAVKGEQLIERFIMNGKPVLGICVGEQIMFEKGVEHGIESEGLGQWQGTVEKLDAPTLPHIGWNTVEAPEGSKLFEGIENERFYFVHSYAAKHWSYEPTGPFEKPKVTYADYGGKFIAAVESQNVFATQFHPEKSGEAGIQLLKNWLKTFRK